MIMRIIDAIEELRYRWRHRHDIVVGKALFRTHHIWVPFRFSWKGEIGEAKALLKVER